MAEHVWSILCGRALVDRDTNVLSLIDVITDLALERLSEEELSSGEVRIPQQFALVSLWTRTRPTLPEQGQARLRIIAPSSAILAINCEVAVELLSEARAQTVGMLEEFPIQGVGTYHLVVEYRDKQSSEWRECKRLPLEVWLSTHSED